MFIAVRKELNGSIYFDTNFFNRFKDEDLAKYGMTKVLIPDVINKYEISANDFNDDLTFNIVKHHNRLRKIEINKLLIEYDKKLKDLDYIGVKIATGRATREEYIDKIVLMTNYANKINKLQNELKNLE